MSHPPSGADRPQDRGYEPGGYLVPHGDVERLAARMLELADAPARVAELGAGARRFAEGLTWDRTAVETERHLRDIIEGSATR